MSATGSCSPKLGVAPGWQLESLQRLTEPWEAALIRGREMRKSEMSESIVAIWLTGWSWMRRKVKKRVTLERWKSGNEKKGFFEGGNGFGGSSTVKGERRK